MTTKLDAYGYAVIRRCKSDNREFIDTTTLSAFKCLAEDKTRTFKGDSAISAVWADQNPVVRIARIKLVEIED